MAQAKKSQQENELSVSLSPELMRELGDQARALIFECPTPKLSAKTDTKNEGAGGHPKGSLRLAAIEARRARQNRHEGRVQCGHAGNRRRQLQ